MVSVEHWQRTSKNRSERRVVVLILVDFNKKYYFLAYIMWNK